MGRVAELGSLRGYYHAMKKTALPDFTGKLIQVSLVGDNHGYAMESPRFEKQGGKLFLTGRVPPGGTSSNWSEGALCAVVWDSVTDYLVFASAKHYEKRREVFRKHARRA